MPPSPAAALRRAAGRLAADYAAARIPCPLPDRGGDLAGSPTTSAAAVRAVVASLGAGDNLDAGFAALRAWRDRLDFLAGSDPRTRAALARWAGLERAWAAHVSAAAAASPAAAAVAQARAFAAGAALLPRVARPPAVGTMSGGGGGGGGGAGDAPGAGPWADEGGRGVADFPSDDEDDARHAAAAGAAADALATLEADVRTAVASGRFEDGDGGGGGGGGGRGGAPPRAPAPPASSSAARARALASALHAPPAGLKAVPVEWLYAGLAPLLPGPVAAARRGVPAGVAAVAAEVAARCGLAALPAGVLPGGRAAAPPPPAAAAAALPPAAAARLRAALAGPPGPDAAGGPGAWVLVCPDGAWAWDPSTGRVVEAVGGAGAGGLPSAAAAAAGWSPSAAGGAALALGARRGWAALLRTAVIAHTRRGDAEAVAGVLPQLLALDADAEEWGVVVR